MKKDLVEKGGILQRDRETYAIAPHIPGGITDAATLRKICEVAERFGVKELKLTSAQRIAMMGVKEEDLDAIWMELGEKPGAAIGLCVRSVKICPGTDWCKRALQDSRTLGLELDRRYHGMALPNKLKMGVSGCMLSCAEVWVKDIGLMGTAKGWKILVGGNAGLRPRIAEVLTEVATTEEALEVVEKIMAYYRGYPKGERLGRVLDEMGIEAFRSAVLGE